MGKGMMHTVQIAEMGSTVIQECAQDAGHAQKTNIAMDAVACLLVFAKIAEHAQRDSMQLAAAARPMAFASNARAAQVANS